jgi:polysaccharide biosynthesis transport protein
MNRSKMARRDEQPSYDSWEQEDDTGFSANPFQNFGLTKYIEPVFVYKTWLLMWILGSALGCWLALLFWPRTYESECKLQFNVGRESVGLDPTSTTTQTLMLQKTQEENVNTALELLGSRELAEMVVNDIGIDNINSGNLPVLGQENKIEAESIGGKFVGWVTDLGMSVLDRSGVRDQIGDMERAVIKVQKQVDIRSPKKSTVMIVQAQAKSPHMAQAIVQSLTKHFLTKQVNVSTTVGSLDFFDTQANSAEDRVHLLLDKRSKMLQGQKIASTESKNNALTTQLAVIESTILNTKAQMKRTDSEIEDLSERIVGLEEEVVSSRQTSVDPGVSGMRSQLYASELEEKRRSAIYTKDHPLLVQIREQNQSGRDVLEKLTRESQSQSTTPNPLRLTLEEDLFKAKNAAVGLQALLTESLAQKDEKQSEIRELLDFEVEFSEVNREVDSAKSSLIALRDKQEQARVVDSLRNKHISSIAVSQPASFSERPSDPKKVLVVAAFMLLGLGGGVGLVGLKEFSRKTIRRPEEAERRLGYPVLASVPENASLKRDGLASKKRTYKLLKSQKLNDVHDGCRTLMTELYIDDDMSDSSEAAIGKTIGIVGVRDGCGASSLAMMLALQSTDNEGLKTTLVDLDLRKRTISNVFGLFRQTGPTGNELATGKTGSIDSMQHLTRDSLSLVGSTSASHSSRSDVDSKEIKAMLDNLALENDIVIVDLPPANRPSNLIQIAKYLDYVIVVIESEATESKAAERLVARLEKSNVHVAGLVVNKCRQRVPAWLERLLG